MKKLKFINGKPPRGFKLDFEQSLFNSEAHRLTQSKSGWYSYSLVREDKKLVVASIHFCVKKGVASSPLSAPFGAYEFSDSLSVEQLYAFMEHCERDLQSKKVFRIKIVAPPEQYNLSQHNIISVLLTNHGFRIANAELGACLSIDETYFVSRIDKWEKRRWKQAEKAPLQFKPIPIRSLKLVYVFINNCRKAKGHSLSMDYESLNETVKANKGSFYLFGVYNNGELIAASISIRVKTSILYNFYSAHSKESDALSPIVFLTGHLYDWCYREHITLLDLGTSALGGKPNFPLIDFKLRLGAAPSMKLTFEKDLK